MTKVNLEVIKPWITKRVNDILGFEDDVVIEFIFNQLEDKVMSYFFIFVVGFCFGLFLVFPRRVRTLRLLHREGRQAQSSILVKFNG